MNGTLIADQAEQIKEVIEALQRGQITYEEAQRLIRDSAKRIAAMAGRD